MLEIEILKSLSFVFPCYVVITWKFFSFFHKVFEHMTLAQLGEVHFWPKKKPSDSMEFEKQKKFHNR